MAEENNHKSSQTTSGHHHHHHHHHHANDGTSRFRQYMFSRRKRNKLIVKVLLCITATIAIIVACIVLWAYKVDERDTTEIDPSTLVPVTWE